MSWKLKAFKYYYIPLKEIGLGGIVVEPTPDMVEAAKETDRCTGTVHVTHRYRRRLREDAECARDQPGHPRCASDLSFRSYRRALQPACHHRSRHGQISGHATSCALPCVQLFGGRNLCLSVRQLWNCCKAPASVQADAVRRRLSPSATRIGRSLPNRQASLPLHCPASARDHPCPKSRCRRYRRRPRRSFGLNNYLEKR